MALNYDERRTALIAYLNMKVGEGDWHAVSDAANDLRVLEAQKPKLMQYTDYTAPVGFDHILRTPK